MKPRLMWWPFVFSIKSKNTLPIMQEEDGLGGSKMYTQYVSGGQKSYKVIICKFVSSAGFTP